MSIVICLLLGFIVVCAMAVSFNRRLLNSILIFMVYSVVMSVIWMILESPDLAITEAAVGAGITTVLFFLTLRRLQKIDMIRREEEEALKQSENKNDGAEIPEQPENKDDGAEILKQPENKDDGAEILKQPENKTDEAEIPDQSATRTDDTEMTSDFNKEDPAHE